ncbi:MULTISPECIES: MFS transporter [Brevibacterium]|nr:MULTISPECIES: MFS transporter [Brevibacterium]
MSQPPHELKTGRGLDALALLCLVLIAASLRPAATSLGPVLAEVQSEFALHEWQVGLLTALPGVCFAAFGLVAIPLLRRLGLFTTLALSCVLIGAGILVRALVGDWTGFALLTVLALIGMAVGNVVLPVYVKARFPERGQLGSTVFTVSLGLGAMFPSLFTAPLAQDFSTWRVGLGAWALIPVAGLVVWIVLRAAHSVPVVGASATSAPESQAPRRHIFTSSKARFMAMFFGLQSVNAYVQFGWLPQIYRDAGLDPVLAGVMMTIVTFGGIPGGFIAPQIIARGILPRTIVASFAVAGVLGYLGLLAMPATLPALWAALLSYAGFAFPAALALITARTRAVSVTARTSAFVQPIGYVLAAVCPLVVGGLLGLSGGWTVPLLFMIGVCVLMGITGVIAAAPGSVDDEL